MQKNSTSTRSIYINKQAHLFSSHQYPTKSDNLLGICSKKRKYTSRSSIRFRYRDIKRDWMYVEA